eukprot:gene9146-9314_t
MQFVQQYSHLGYGYTGRIDELRATQFPQLQNVTYLDHAAATLYSLQQLADATQELSQHLFANPHSQLGHDVDHTSSAIDNLRALTLQMLKAPAEEYEGPVVSFNLLRADGSWVGHKEVAKLAQIHGICVRTGDFDNHVTDDVSSLDDEACLGLVNWLDFYHKTYPFKGLLAGAFYDSSGASTPTLASVHSRAEKGREIQAAREKEEQNWPSCNSKWTEAEGGEVWCDDGLYPRKLFVNMVNGRASWRCACFKELGWSDVRKVYAECAPDATSCSTDAEVDDDDGDVEENIKSMFAA